MPKQSVDEVISGLDDKIVDIVGQFVRRRKSEYEEAAKRLKESLREDVIRYSELLDKKKISTEDFEFLVRGRSAQLKVELLEQVSVSKSKFDLVSHELLGVLIKTVISVIAAV